MVIFSLLLFQSFSPTMILSTRLPICADSICHFICMTLLFGDNLDSQVNSSFFGASRHLLVAGCYHLCTQYVRFINYNIFNWIKERQKCYTGIGSILKCLMAQVQDEWLDIEDNLLAWEEDSECTQKFDTKRRKSSNVFKKLVLWWLQMALTTTKYAL